jgi:hypothetical protein
MSLIDEPLPSLYPETFFGFSAPIYQSLKIPAGRTKRSFLLPHSAELLDEEKFADVYMSWDEEGLCLFCESNRAFVDSAYPRFDEGDSLELFIDTRDLKEMGIIHRFCHHFLFLPIEVQGVRALEITHFRGEDNHPLAEPSQLLVETVFEKKSYSLSIYLPKEALYGYDPANVPRLGFSYCFHRKGGKPQHFPISSRACSIGRVPFLWASLQLEKSTKS